MNFADNFLNSTTIYRLMLYYLSAILIAAFLISFSGALSIDPAALAFSCALIIGTCWVTNRLCAYLFSAAANVESIYITAFILTLIITPVAATNFSGVGFLVFASATAMASKFLIAPGKKHILNPAAFGVALSALTINQSASWWVVAGNLPLLAVILIGGLLMVRKVQRFEMVISFTLMALISAILTLTSGDIAHTLTVSLLHSALIFFAFIMLTEPLTTPPSRVGRIIYGGLVGLIFAPNVHIGSFYSTPELALLLGNIFSYLISPKGRFMLTLKSIRESANDTFDFTFVPDRQFSFQPGQYLEWTLPHAFPDARGNRRFFTIASSPTEKDVLLGLKFYPKSSTFKRALGGMQVGDKISASSLAGSLTLPSDPRKKIVFIAGGIGVTPFRSMFLYLLDKKEARPIVMLYSNKTAGDIAYKDIFDRAYKELNIKTIYALTNKSEPVPGMHSGSIDADLITREIPDYQERIFYISGPRAMVETFKKTLTGLKVSRFKIKSDFFPGYV